MTANSHSSTINKVPPGGSERIPFSERLTCSVDDATEASGLSRSMIYIKMNSGEIEWTKIGARRLIKVPSLLRFLGLARLSLLKINVMAVGRGTSRNVQSSLRRLDAHSDGADRQLPGRQ